MLKLGKKPARPNSVKFKFSRYANTTKLPKPPGKFGHETLIGSTPWQTLGNDQYGDCVFAGAAHETMIWGATGGHPVNFNDVAVLSDYSAVTGFDPRMPNTDQGTDMQEAASYRLKTGIVDSSGGRHRVAAYLAVDPGNITQMYQALWLFGAVGIGIQFPDSAMSQFDKGKPWRVMAGAKIEGGHYVPLVAKRTYLECVTWGKIQSMTAGFLKKYCDECIVYISQEAMINQRSAENFDYDTLLADLQALKVSSPR